MDRVKNWAAGHIALIVYPAGAVLTGLLALLAPLNGTGVPWLYLGALALALFALRPGSPIHRATVEDPGWGGRICALVLMAALIAALILPMGELSLWNGKQPDHRNQYELLAEAFLDGRIDLAYGDEEGLLSLNNPYDPGERDQSGVIYHWDHAFYKGHYYMYFGVAPVLLVFLPYRVLTGRSLTTYHATQLFALAMILGIFALFHKLAMLFYKKLPNSVWLAMSSAVSILSVWYATAEPALYCTAITSALAMVIWSLYFFVWAVYGEKREGRQIALAFLGALLGALAFACRPSVALANLAVLPMLAVFLRRRRITPKLLLKLCLAALPYVVVAAGLMWYNYVRFENPFEFGQAYQLTVADQSGYHLSLGPMTLLRAFNGEMESLFSFSGISGTFPYLYTAGSLFNFPILLLGVGMCRSASREKLRGDGLLWLERVLGAAVLIIIAVDVMWAPYLLERYHMDVYLLMGVVSFIALGAWHSTAGERDGRRLAAASCMLSLATAVCAFLFYVRTVAVYYPEKIQQIGQALGLA